METRNDPRPTYKLFIGGAFPRGESGRSYPVADTKEKVLANVTMASRRDARDAIAAACMAQPSWGAGGGYHRGRILFEVAAALDGSRARLEDDVAAAEGTSPRRSAATVDAAIERWAWYAGWADKTDDILGTHTPVGVVGIISSQASSLLGLVSAIAPAIATGNTCVTVAAQLRPLPAMAFAEILASAHVPGGVVNILTGNPAELGPALAASSDVTALDLTGVEDDALTTEMEVLAADRVARVLIPPRKAPDWTEDPGLGRMRQFVTTTGLPTVA